MSNAQENISTFDLTDTYNKTNVYGYAMIPMLGAPLSKLGKHPKEIYEEQLTAFARAGVLKNAHDHSKFSLSDILRLVFGHTKPYETKELRRLLSVSEGVEGIVFTDDGLFGLRSLSILLGLMIVGSTECKDEYISTPIRIGFLSKTNEELDFPVGRLLTRHEMLVLKDQLDRRWLNATNTTSVASSYLFPSHHKGYFETFVKENHTSSALRKSTLDRDYAMEQAIDCSYDDSLYISRFTTYYFESLFHFQKDRQFLNTLWVLGVHLGFDTVTGNLTYLDNQEFRKFVPVDNSSNTQKKHGGPTLTSLGLRTVLDDMSMSFGMNRAADLAFNMSDHKMNTNRQSKKQKD